MNLYELQKAITDSTGHEWSRIAVGPFYHDRIWVADDLEFTGDSHSHDARAVLISDLSISIEWGLRVHSRGDGDEHHLWASEPVFPDPSITSYWVDVFYNGAVVDREQIIAVDGHRAYLPNYHQARIDGGDPTDYSNAVFEFTTTSWQHGLARIVNELSGSDDWETNYLARSGIKRI